MSALRDRHDRDTRLMLIRRERAALGQKETAPGDLLPANLDVVVADLWPGWTPMTTGIDYRTTTDGIWVFTHPDHGWGVMFLPEAKNRWRANRGDALKMLLDLSASGPDLTVVCTRLLGERNFALSFAAQAVARLVTLQTLRQPLRTQQVEFLLALSGLTGGLGATAEFHDYGTPFSGPGGPGAGSGGSQQ